MPLDPMQYNISPGMFTQLALLCLLLRHPRMTLPVLISTSLSLVSLIAVLIPLLHPADSAIGLRFNAIFVHGSCSKSPESGKDHVG